MSFGEKWYSDGSCHSPPMCPLHVHQNPMLIHDYQFPSTTYHASSVISEKKPSKLPAFSGKNYPVAISRQSNNGGIEWVSVFTVLNDNCYYFINLIIIQIQFVFFVSVNLGVFVILHSIFMHCFWCIWKIMKYFEAIISKLLYSGTSLGLVPEDARNCMGIPHNLESYSFVQCFKDGGKALKPDP